MERIDQLTKTRFMLVIKKYLKGLSLDDKHYLLERERLGKTDD